MTTQEVIKKTGDFIRNSATIKILSIGVIVLILLIPTSMISSLMREREYRKDAVVQEISQKWGNSQVITGPFITIPYKVFYKDDKDRVKYNVHHLNILPEALHVTGELDPQIRYRSIYEAVLYKAKLKAEGSFRLPLLEHADIKGEDIIWGKAVFSIGISDMRGIKNNITLNFRGEDYEVKSGLRTTDIAASGVHCHIPLSADMGSGAFSFELILNGSDGIHLVPAGETTTLNLESTWASPSFGGAYLPVTRAVSEKGFTAEWKVLHLNRNYPQFWADEQYAVADSAFGVRLLITADIYQKSIRISKYAIMFIGFTFSAFFFAEIINRNRVHPIQYILIGLAVILFYVLLLSISEHIAFDLAYLLSALAITLIVTLYAKGIIKNNYFTLTVGGILVLLYAYLYIVLQLEDYALLMGSIGLLLVLATIMYITRRIDWYALEKDP
jgi:inner membrane protein